MNPQQQNLNDHYQTLLTKHTNQPTLSPDTHKQLITQFTTINKSIQQKLQHYTKLISTYIDKVENTFLISFTKVLQKMGNDLMLAEQAYKSIDQQIMTNQKCLNLLQDKIFFINQSNYYQKQFNFKSKEVDKLKQKNYLLIKQNTGLKEKLFEKVKQILFYKQKSKKLQKLPASHPQNHNNQQTAQTAQPSPFKISINNRLNNSDSKKWASYGRQTQEQKRQKEEEKQKQKKNLLVDIRKQLKTRQKISLQQIMNRSFVQGQQKKQIKPLSLKKVNFSEKNECYTERIFRKSLQKQPQNQNKSLLNSTVASNLPFSQLHESFNQRSLHTSNERR